VLTSLNKHLGLTILHTRLSWYLINSSVYKGKNKVGKILPKVSQISNTIIASHSNLLGNNFINLELKDEESEIESTSDNELSLSPLIDPYLLLTSRCLPTMTSHLLRSSTKIRLLPGSLLEKVCQYLFRLQNIPDRQNQKDAAPSDTRSKVGLVC
jgi:hypothetical protein